MSNTRNRRSFFGFAAATGAATGLAFVSGMPVANAVTRYPLGSKSTQASTIDWQFENEIANLANDLSNLPSWLLYAKPNEVPNYEAKLRHELGKINNGRSLTIRPASSSKNGYTQAGAWECTVAAVPFLASFGVSAFKIFSIINNARKSWGSIRMAVTAMRNGENVAEIGEEGLKILEEILGISAVRTACNI